VDSGLELENEVAGLIVTELKLEDVTPGEIDPEAPLFGEGLGLDSIDALELALAVSQRYGFNITSDDPLIGEMFSSLRSLTAHIARNRTK
jgi:acyl carrier protein